ncbi:MAG: helix-hairpin-helix domain-containing protein [Opitutaceae bacterium]|nr:helix-hairpin-helix domain-containing protein [Opitutaceae bacterium]
MSPRAPTSQRGSVLIIVIWVCLGLVALALYFADSMSSELRAADNRAAQLEAQQAVAAGTRYAAFVLGQFATGGAVPRNDDYQSAAVPVGEAQFWFVGRDPHTPPTDEPFFGLVDEASKLNLNTASRAMLEALPGMTPELAESILAWRRRAGSEDSGADSNVYARLDPPRLNKGGNFESVDELRLVYGMTLDVLFGEDANRNGALDASEDDGEQTSPRDDGNGQLLAGIAEHVTIHSRQPARGPSGSRRIDIRTPQSRQQLNRLLQQRLGNDRAAAVQRAIGTREFQSVAEFMWDSGLTAEEFAQIHGELTHRDGNISGLVNVNTATETVLACIPGLSAEAATIVAYRQTRRDELTSFAWLKESGITRQAIARAGPFITGQSYQFTADVAAVGRLGRGYARARTVFDTSTGTPRAVYHQDLTAAGWALGTGARQATRPQRDF